MSKAMPSGPGNIRVSDELYLQIQRLCHYSQRLPNINVFGTTLRTFTSISKPVDESDDKSSPVGTKIIEIDTISWSDDPAKWLKETCMSYQFADKKKSTVDKLLPDQWMNTHNASHWTPRIMKAMWKKRNLGTDVLEAENFGRLTSREQSLLLSCLKKSEADDRYVCDFMALCEAVNRLEDATDLEKIAANLLEKIIVFQSHASPEKHCEVHHTWPVCALGSTEDPRNYKVVSWKAHLLCHVALASLFPSIRGFNLTVARMLHLGESKLTEEEILACLEREELVGAAANARERAYQDLLDATQRQWDNWFNQLLAFKDEHGHCLVPVSFPGLGMWVAKQRCLSRKDILSDDRKRQLEAIGFVWNPLDEQWDGMMEQLAAFKDENGHCLVPRSFLGLGRWVDTQRVLYRKDILSDDRKRELEAIGIVWNPLDDQWDNWFNQLLAFKDEHGHCLVPRSFPGLCRWVDKQRGLYRKDILRDDRKQELEAIGFVWNPLDEQWDNWFNQLLAFKDEHGHCLVPVSFPGLGMWVAKQRCLSRKDILSDDRKRQLEAIGFVWNPFDE